ncbi:uncharacterized protein L3040_007674 [Drepanopeziza brunnea f. sp. 'multigermtubi']|uniref:uncharacterized protein n=1 Tax=Drepanopeziza brunnea f. sp. 'multigermtubi' TaxID=698441 RepID=UPI00239CC577|nr:hypothetical protein L3040_007674 [Drepanopeziza brunnea f. sp. 'multigermtubi']
MAETDFSSLSAGINWEDQGEEGELLFEHALNPMTSLDLRDTGDHGVKAADAQDYEDISDDDLPEEEQASGNVIDDAPGLTEVLIDDAPGNDDLFGDDDDDLFGDGGRASSPFAPQEQEDQPQTPLTSGLSFPTLESQVEVQSQPEPQEPAEPEESAEYLYKLNFNTDDDHDVWTEEQKEKWTAENYPDFQKGEIINFTSFFPPKEAYFIPQIPDKLPKPLHPTKVSLNIAPDTEKLFRTPGPAQSDKYTRMAEDEAKGLVSIIEDSEEEEGSDDEFDFSPISPTSTVGGFTMMDLQVICADFESHLDAEPLRPVEEQYEEPQDEWERQIFGPQKRKYVEPEFVYKPELAIPNFDNFEKMTAQLGKRVILDPDDPNLLLEFIEDVPTVKRRRLDSGKPAKGGHDVASALRARFNYSNDEAYAMLKENHGKVRATVGSLAIEHSAPAQKLQWPYYRTKLDAREARQYHRPSLKFGKVLNQPIYFSKPSTSRKKKDMRDVPIQEAFKTTKDLSLSEYYSSATLIEYSEEHPTVLSNFGMGNRIVNYYRRKNAEDKEGPAKPDDHVGDSTILLPEDRSPFANFGTVEPGETVRAIHNGMYRAPIFKHEPKSEDFLVVRSSTGVDGPSWHIRNIDNLFVAGQQLPSMEIPGPHARRVTNASKNRMKMIAFRMMRRHPKGEMQLSALTAHCPENTEIQNKQKAKEFMRHDRDAKAWKLKDSEGPIPDAAGIRAMVKPEDVCAIDAMEVGLRHLKDSGFAASEEVDMDREPGTETLEQKLAPWNTTKAFMDAASGKAMLELHGHGDPTGCGLGISMIKVSMKGGYLEGLQQGELSTAAARVALDRKANNGHHYNVKAQNTLYSDGIQRVWNAQKSDLSNQTQLDEMDIDCPENPSFAVARAAAASPPPSPGNTSVFSEPTGHRTLTIERTVLNMYGQEEVVTEVITDQKVISGYKRRRFEEDIKHINVYDLKPTGDPETDRIMRRHIREEVDRLEKNKTRRIGRENTKKSEKGVKGGNNKGSSTKTKGPKSAAEGMMSPSSTPTLTIEKSSGTSRKCANCGQAGHIKTNKKLCPMLNGTMSNDPAPTDTVEFGFGPPPGPGGPGFGPGGDGGFGPDDGSAGAPSAPIQYSFG